MTITGVILAQFRTIGMVFAITLVKAEAKAEAIKNNKLN